MKIHLRIAALAMSATMLLALAACGSKSEDDKTTGEPIGDVAATYAPEHSAEPSPSPTVVPTPTPTPLPSPSPTPTPEPSPTPSETVEPSVEPSTEPSAEPSQEPSAVDLAAFFKSVSSAYDFSGMAEMDATLLDNYYPGLSAISTNQLVAYMAMITASANEIVLVECANAGDVAAVQSILEARKQSQADGGAWYPATIEQWSNAQICVSGNYVMLVCHANASDIAASFYALFA